ncbi:hypothetical protein AGMMS50293_23050 [Spirochaetia bacterium]|nr:hypothetical protein AGMMS50293_23050 [Spirochaetia bacterium]
MIQYKCFELHNHTLHSDGQFTPESLCEAAKKYEYDGIALTDHNTMSGIEAMAPELMRKTLPVIPGIEWTTFFGHMVVIGAEKYIDWRFALPDDIDSHIAQVKAANGIVGIAHPFRVGSPFCTGCHWEFNIKNWDQINYIEVWEGTFPHKQFSNTLAFRWWTSLLNQGHKIAAGSGRDWHRLEDEPALTTATYLGIIDGIITAVSVKDAIVSGRTFVTCGPVLELSLLNGRGVYSLGETVEAGAYTLRLKVDEDKRRHLWEQFNIKTETVRLVQNGAVVKSISCNGAYEGTCDINLLPGWLRVEGYGQYLDEAGKLLFFSSPVYVGSTK